MLAPDQIAEAKKLAKLGSLTWEDIIQAMGSTTETWELASQHMPYLATIRNVRNMLGWHTTDYDPEQARKPISIEIAGEVANRIDDSATVKVSKVFPFRLLAAYKSIETDASIQANLLRTALTRALSLSIANVPTLSGLSVIAADVSASMRSRLSERSVMEYIHISQLMAAMSVDICAFSLALLFGTEARAVAVTKAAAVLDRYNLLEDIGRSLGNATYGYKVIEHLIDNEIHADRIIVFTDMQLYAESHYSDDFVGYWQTYRRKNPACKLYIVDLAGYGNCMVPENDPNVHLIGGWSEAVFKYINIAKNLDQLNLNMPAGGG